MRVVHYLRGNMLSCTERNCTHWKNLLRGHSYTSHIQADHSAMMKRRALKAMSHTDNIHGRVIPRSVNRRPNLNGVELRVVTNAWPPFVMTETDESGQYRVYGFSIDILVELSHLLNFTYVLDADSGIWGVEKEDGNWSGMVGQLQRRQRDMIVGALGYQAERTKVMDFTVAFDRLDVTFWILDPRLRQQIWLAIFDMLDLSVTCLLLASTGLLALLLMFTSSVASTRQKTRFERSIVVRAYTLLGALMGQGSREQPHTWSGKTILGSWWLFSLVFSVTYTATLIASLSANITQLPFTSAAAMYRQTEYQYGILADTTEQMFLETITNKSIFKDLWKGIGEASTSDPRVLSTEYKVHAERVTQDKYVFIGVELPWSEYFGQAERAVVTFGEVLYTKSICFGLQLNSPYTSAMSTGLTTLMEFGIVRKLRQKWWPARPAFSELSNVDAIPLQTVSGVYFALGMGLVLASLSLVVELVIIRIRMHKTKRQSFVPD